MNVGVCENVSKPLAGKQRNRRAATELLAMQTRVRGLSLGAHRSFFRNDLSGVLHLSLWR